MLKAWEKLFKFAGKITNLKGWLSRLAYSFCIDILRQNNRGAYGVENLEAISWEKGKGLVTSFDTPAIVLESSALLGVMRDAIDEKPDNQCQASILRLDQELSYQQIAQQLNISNDNVRKRIERARKRLKKNLNNYLAGWHEKAYGEKCLLKEIWGEQE